MVTSSSPGHLAISASAGSGKTFRLAHRYLALLALGVPPDRICALTFSRKAAGEIFDSIVGYLSRAAAADADAAETRSHLGLPGTDPVDFAPLLRHFVEHLHRLTIGTLDSFTVGIVQAFPAELGLATEFGMLDENGPEAALHRERILDRLYDPRLVGEADLEQFIEAYKQATFGMEEKRFDDKIGSFIQETRETYQLVPDGLCWGMESRVWPGGSPWEHAAGDPRLAREQLQPWLEAQAGKLPRTVLDLADFAAAYDTTTRWDSRLTGGTVFTRLLEQMDDLARGEGELLYRRKTYALPPEAARAWYVLLHHVLRIEMQRALQETRGLHAVLDIYEKQYEAQLRRTGQLTFQDAQYLLTEDNLYNGGTVLSRRGGGDGRLFIDYRLDSQLDHWLLDEFQDTSSLQWAVLHNLVDEIVQDASGTRSFFYVGDIKQAIYGWRGGNARLFEEVYQHYHPAIAREPLNTSHRSSPPVIETVNRLFGNLDGLELPPAAVQDWQTAWAPHACSDRTDHLPGYAALVEPPNDGKTHTSAEERYEVTAALVRQLRPLEQGLEIAVLTRGNEAAGEAAHILRAQCPGIPVHLEGRAALLDNPVVSLLLALVRCATHPGDTASRAHLRMSPLGPSLPLDDPALSLHLLDTLNLRGLQAFLRHWGEQLDLAAPLDTFGRLRLEALTEQAARFDASGSRDPRAFLTFIEEAEIDEQTSGGGVRIMTIHKSKGLGFDVIILPDLMSRRSMAGSHDASLTVRYRDEAALQADWVLRTPRREVIGQDPVLQAEEEEAVRKSSFEALCVLYVAVTRAKQALYMVTGFPGRSSTTLSPGTLVKQQLCGAFLPEAITTLDLEGLPVDLLYETGNRDWAETSREPAVSAPLPAPTLAARFHRRTSRRRKLQRLEPSASSVAGEAVAGLFAPRRQDDFDLGSAVHEIFEHVSWFEDLDPDATVADWKRGTPWSGETARMAEELFRQALAEPALQQALARPGPEAELWREKTFEIVLDQRWVSGIFDRVVIERDPETGRATGAVILDYKSNQAADPEAVEALVEHYTPQLQAYRKALAAILHLAPDRIRCQLMFLRPNVVRDVPA